MLPVGGVGTFSEPQTVFTTSNSADGFPHAQDPKILSPGHLKFSSMVMKCTLSRALNSPLLMTVDVECNPGHTQLCNPCGEVSTSKVPECVKCGIQRHGKCSSLTRSEAVQCQWLNSVICYHCNSNAGDR